MGTLLAACQGRKTCGATLQLGGDREEARNLYNEQKVKELGRKLDVISNASTPASPITRKKKR